MEEEEDKAWAHLQNKKITKKFSKINKLIDSSSAMAETVVTRGGQITLGKKIRTKLSIKEGDIVQVNTLGDTVIISKRDPGVFDTGGFLHKDFPKHLKKMKKFDYASRLIE